VPIVNDVVSEGVEPFRVRLSNPTGHAAAGPQADAAVTIAKSDPLPAGTVFTDSDGDVVTFRMTGPGTPELYLTNGRGPVAELDLAGSDPEKTVVGFGVKRPAGGAGNGHAGVGQVVETDGLGPKTLALAKADVTGAGLQFNGYVGSVAVGDVSNGADVTLAGSPPPKARPVTITAGVVSATGRPSPSPGRSAA